MKCPDCNGEMKRKDFWWDIRWYECEDCGLREGSDGTIIRKEERDNV